MPQPGVDQLYFGDEDWDIPVTVDNAGSNRFRDQTFRQTTLDDSSVYPSPLPNISMFLSLDSLLALTGHDGSGTLLHEDLLGLVFVLGIDEAASGNNRLKMIARSANGRAIKPAEVSEEKNLVATAAAGEPGSAQTDSEVEALIQDFVATDESGELGKTLLYNWADNGHPTFRFNNADLLDLYYTGNSSATGATTLHLILFSPPWPWAGFGPPLSCFTKHWISAAAVGNNQKKGLAGCPPNCYDGDYCS